MNPIFDPVIAEYNIICCIFFAEGDHFFSPITLSTRGGSQETGGGAVFFNSLVHDGGIPRGTSTNVLES